MKWSDMPIGQIFYDWEYPAISSRFVYRKTSEDFFQELFKHNLTPYPDEESFLSADRWYLEEKDLLPFQIDDKFILLKSTL